MEISLRLLTAEDAKISYKWRNNPAIWKYTGKKPDKIITPTIELNWIKEVLKRENEARYAICTEENRYIGNIQITDMKDGRGEFHIFIGEEKYWGKGIGTIATKKMVGIGFSKYHLNEIYLKVNRNNIAAIKAYEKVGFTKTDERDSEIKMVIKK